jgi:hypothetical protein
MHLAHKSCRCLKLNYLDFWVGSPYRNFAFLGLAMGVLGGACKIWSVFNVLLACERLFCVYESGCKWREWFRRASSAKSPDS